MDFSVYIYKDDFTFISQKPGLRNSSLVLAAPFAPLVWALIVVVYFVLSWIIFALSSAVLRDPRVTFASVHFHLFAIYLNNCKCS